MILVNNNGLINDLIMILVNNDFITKRFNNDLS